MHASTACCTALTMTRDTSQHYHEHMRGFICQHTDKIMPALLHMYAPIMLLWAANDRLSDVQGQSSTMSLSVS